MDMVCWRDSVSGTVGIARFNKAIVLAQESVVGLSVSQLPLPLISFL